ncbi:MAG: hypothetical protein LUF90_02895 [Rikenellaceae bacterium]|nr:hypothetical protein [Rikenellaceae bacterium]
MAKYTLEEVKTGRQRKHFLDLPKKLYREDKNWVCPIDDDIEKIFDPARNELFNGGEAIRWILKDDGSNIVGRIAAFYNNEVAATSEQPTGGCGFFECINDQEAASVLFDVAKYWLQSKGMEAMDGPINFGDRSDWWGVLVEGFTQPLYCNPYNFPYYKELFENYGFQNYFNQYTYSRQLTVGDLNPAVVEKAERLFNTPGYHFGYAKDKELHEYAEDFRTIYNKGWAKFTGVKPIDREHAQELFKKMKPIIDRKLLYFAYYEGEPIGFFIMVPDLNRIIGKFNGRFGWMEKIRFIVDLKLRKKADRIVGIIFGVVPEFRGKGIEGGMIRRFEEVVEKVGYKSLELAWIGDFNPVMMRIVESYVRATKFKTHVTYRYLFDRNKEFSRAPKLGREKKK